VSDAPSAVRLYKSKLICRRTSRPRAPSLRRGEFISVVPVDAREMILKIFARRKLVEVDEVVEKFGYQPWEERPSLATIS